MNQKPLQVLLVEDSAGDVSLIRAMLKRDGPASFELTHMVFMSDAEAHLAKGGVDLVLLDMGLPDAHGLDSLRRAHAAAPGVPLIVMTGLEDEALAAEAMAEGAQDYMIKGQIESRALPRALRHAIERHRMQTEADIAREHQVQFKDEFLSHVSHELRSPLTAIRLFVTILMDKLAGELNLEQAQYLETILRNVKQLQSMIDDLFEVSGIQAGKLRIELQLTSASDAIVYAVNTLQGAASAKHIALSSEIESRLPVVFADPTRLRQVLIILVDNAIKFTPANGTVKVHACVDKEDPRRLVMDVSDSGPGISPEMSERIFERLVQASDPGTAGRKGLGLGLFICKELVTQQGGQIRATCDPGQGAVFTVTLPIFSLPHLLAPAFKNRKQMEGPVTLVVTEMGSRTGWLSEEKRVEHYRGVMHLLQTCLHSDLDVLLPKMGSAGAVELFFIVAMTDAIGGEAITKRIRERLDGCDEVQQAGLTFKSSYRPLAAIQRQPDEDIEDFLEQMAASIQELMNDETASRTVKEDGEK
jgi:signal transduction histidine kinase